MDCRTVHDHLSAYLDRDLPLQTWEQLDTHLRRCARCRREFTQLQTVAAWVRDLPRIEPSPTFLQQVCQRLEGLPHRSPARIFRRLTGALPFQVAAALVVAVSAALVWRMAPDIGQQQVKPAESPAQIEPWLSRDRTAIPAMEVPPLEQLFEDALPTPAPLVQSPARRPLFVAREGFFRSTRDVSTMPMASGVPADVRVGEITLSPTVILQAADPMQAAQQVWEIVPRIGGGLLHFQGMVNSEDRAARREVTVTVSLTADRYQALLEAVRKLPGITVAEERMAFSGGELPQQESAASLWQLEHAQPAAAPKLTLVITILPR